MVVLNADGSEVWCGSMLAFAKENGRDIARDCIQQMRCAVKVHGNVEPAFFGGGAGPEFMVHVVEAA